MARLIDSDILIDQLRGRPQARDFLLDCAASGERLLLSVITHAELLAGVRLGEESAIRALLNRFQALPVTTAVAVEGGRYRREYARSHGVELPDALIAATALVAGARLYTTNTRHYPMGDLRVERPY